jgi:pSer/pThr/pTyr-binding forkhead associated (FHA) protein
MVHEPLPSAKQARLIILATGQSIPLTGQQMLVGRQTSPPLAEVDIRLADRTLSRYQAYLRNSQGTFTVETHPSSVSGNRLNGILLERHREYELKHGDLLRLAAVEVRFEMD